MPEHPPIPSPFGDPAPLSFGAAFWPVFMYSYICGAFGFTLVSVSLLAVGLIDGKAIIFVAPPVLCFLAIFAAIVVSINSSAYKIKVTATGLEGYTFWGRPAQVEWAQVTSITKASFMGLKYLRLTSGARQRELCVPLYLSDLAGFKAAVASLTGPDNPLLPLLK